MKTVLKTTTKTTTDIRPEIDYPQLGEKITSRDYSFRLSAPESADEVGVSINQGPWQACRRSVGYWWYDWSGYDYGEHEIIARARAKNGRWLVSKPRNFVVS